MCRLGTIPVVAHFVLICLLACQEATGQYNNYGSGRRNRGTRRGNSYNDYGGGDDYGYNEYGGGYDNYGGFGGKQQQQKQPSKLQKVKEEIVANIKQARGPRPKASKAGPLGSGPTPRPNIPPPPPLNQKSWVFQHNMQDAFEDFVVAAADSEKELQKQIQQGQRKGSKQSNRKIKQLERKLLGRKKGQLPELKKTVSQWIRKFKKGMRLLRKRVRNLEKGGQSSSRAAGRPASSEEGPKTVEDVDENAPVQSAEYEYEEEEDNDSAHSFREAAGKTPKRRTRG